MKMAGLRSNPKRGKLIALAIVLVALLLSVYAYQRTSRYPSSDDASLDADLVHVASPVGGRIASIRVADNQLVAKGDVLFEIDPVPYRLAVAQARADLELAQAAQAPGSGPLQPNAPRHRSPRSRPGAPSRTTR